MSESHEVAVGRSAKTASAVPTAEEAAPQVPDSVAARPPAPTMARASELAIVFLLLVVVLVLAALGGSAEAIAANMVVWALLAYSFNIIYGFVGAFALGQGLFFGLSGFATVYAYSEFHLSQYVGVVAGLAACGLIAVTVGIPTLRLKGFYFALVSLTLPLIADNIFDGLNMYEASSPQLSNDSVSNFYFTSQGPYIAIGCVCVAVVALASFTWLRCRIGYYWVSIRENPGAAAASGVPTLRYRVYGFLAAAIVAGIAGIMYTEMTGIFSPDDVFGIGSTTFNPSVIALLVALVGGIGTISGPMVGAMVLAPLYSLVTEHWGADAGVNTLVYALALIAVGLWLPGGIWPKLRSWSVGVRGKLGIWSRGR